MSRLTIVAMALCVPVAWAEDPPAPNPNKPVNYVGWVNAQYGKGIKENAANAYREAFEAYVEDDAVLELAKRWDKPWKDHERRRLERWLEQNEQCLARFQAASSMPRCFFELKSETGAMIDVILTESKPFRDISRMLAARAMLRFADGETGGGVEDVATLLQAGRHMESQPYLISYLVGIAVRSLAYQVLVRLPAIAPESVDFEAVVKAVRRVDRMPASPQAQLKTERVYLLDTLQRGCVDENGDGQPDRVRIPGVEDTEFVLKGTIASLVAQHDEFFERWLKIAGSDYATALRLQQEPSADIKARGHSVIRVLVPEFWRVVQLHQRLVAVRSAARIILRMHAFKAQRGRWPTDLKEAGVASSLCKDPFSGEEFIYRVEDGKPLLYSVGENGKDDGGQAASDGRQWSDTGDAILWPVTRAD